jgi:hypothetical protein
MVVNGIPHGPDRGTTASSAFDRIIEALDALWRIKEWDAFRSPSSVAARWLLGLSRKVRRQKRRRQAGGNPPAPLSQSAADPADVAWMPWYSSSRSHSARPVLAGLLAARWRHGGFDVRSFIPFHAPLTTFDESGPLGAAWLSAVCSRRSLVRRTVGRRAT